MNKSLIYVIAAARERFHPGITMAKIRLREPNKNFSASTKIGLHKKGRTLIFLSSCSCASRMLRKALFTEVINSKSFHHFYFISSHGKSSLVMFLLINRSFVHESSALILRYHINLYKIISHFSRPCQGPPSRGPADPERGRTGQVLAIPNPKEYILLHGREE